MQLLPYIININKRLGTHNQTEKRFKIEQHKHKIHTFSAFWLRSSVVSVLNCVNAVTASIGGLTIHTNFLWVNSGFVLHFPSSKSPQACTNPLSGQPSWALIKQKKYLFLLYPMIYPLKKYYHFIITLIFLHLSHLLKNIIIIYTI